MKRTYAITLGAIAGSAVLAVGAFFHDPLALVGQLALLDESAPEKDAASAVASGQPHCYSVNGYARMFPGVQDQRALTFCQAHERNFFGTSDIVMGEWHRGLQRRAYAYAAAYNQHIVRGATLVSK